MGIIQRAMVRSCPHVWFERAEMKDRHLVTKRWDLPIFLSRLMASCVIIFLAVVECLCGFFTAIS